MALLQPALLQPARADTIFLNGNVPPQRMAQLQAAIAPAQVLRDARGRIHLRGILLRLAPGSPPTLDVAICPARVVEGRLVVADGSWPVLSLTPREIRGVVDEMDSLADLRAMLGNADEVIRQPLFSGPWKRALSQALDPDGALGLSPAGATGPAGVQEGWLVATLVRGEPTMADVQRQLQADPFAPALRGRDPEQATLELLAAMARADRYGELEPGFRRHAGEAVDFLCMLAGVGGGGGSPRVDRFRAAGMRARSAVLSAIAAPAAGEDLTAASSTAAQQLAALEEQARRAPPEQRPQLEAALATYRAQLRGQLQDVVTVEDPLAVEPAEVSLVAMSRIQNERRWWLHRADGEELIAALVRAGCEGRARDPRLQALLRMRATQTLVQLVRPLRVGGPQQGRLEEAGRLFRGHLEQLLVAGEPVQRDYVRGVLQAAGFGQALVSKRAVDDLMAQALGIVNLGIEEEIPDAARFAREQKDRRRELREDALATLVVLGRLVASSNPTERALGQYVMGEVKKVRDTHRGLRGGRAEQGFVDALEALPRSQSRYVRESAAEFLDLQRQLEVGGDGPVTPRRGRLDEDDDLERDSRGASSSD